MSRTVIRLLTIFFSLVVIAGFGFLLYPTVSNWLANRKYLVEAESYDTSISQLSDEEAATEMQKAIEYNDNLKGDPVHDPFVPGSGKALPDNYTEVLNINGIMGYVEIPKIDVLLPIYHGTSDEVLKKGIGHIEYTALPIGGQGNHPVLTGHTGYEGSKLFTDLVDMVVGDLFYIHVLNEELIYRVDKITVIVPEDLTELVAYNGMDCVTLLTCTPYGLNTHRLLVRGQRIYRMDKTVDVGTIDVGKWKIIFALCCVGAIVLLGSLIYEVRKFEKAQKTYRT